MKRFILAFLLAAPLLHAIVPTTSVGVNLTSRDLLLTSGDGLGFNVPLAWPVVFKSGSVLELAAGSTLKADSGSTILGITANAGGTNGQLQYNNNNALAGIPTLTWNGLNLTGLAAPVNSSDAAPKSYVDSISAGIVPRTAVVVASTVNLTLSGTQTIDGHATLVGERVLVKNQGTTSQNGIYDCAAGAWSRSSDSNTAATLKFGYYYFVSTGTTQGSTGWTITTAPTVLGTDPVVFGQFSASTTYTAGSGLTLGGNAFSVNAAQPGITSLGTLTGLNASGNSNLAAVNETGAYVIDLGTASGSLPAAVVPASTVMRMANLDTNLSLFEAISWGNAGAAYGVVARSIGGTRAAPQPTPSGYQFYRVNVYGYDGSYNTSSNGAYLIRAMSTWTGLSHETGHSWLGTPAGATAATTWMTLDAQNGLSLLSTMAFKSPNENKMGFAFVTSPIAQYDSTTGGLYFGYGAGAGIIRSVTDNSGNYAPLSVQVGNGTQVGLFTNLGFQGDIGQTTPGKANFTTVNWQDNPSIRTTKTNMHVIETNVIDSGADPSGGSDSSGAFVAALALVPATNGCLLIPPGRYLWSSASTFTISGKTNLTINAEGATFYDNNTAASRPFVVIDKTCSYVKLIGLHFSGNASSRVAGAHQFIINSDHSQVEFCSFTNGSQFSFYIGSDATHVTTDVTVNHIQIANTWADGFHVFNVNRVVIANVQTDTTGDDAIGIGSDDGSHFPNDVTLDGFHGYNAGNPLGAGTHGCTIRIFDGATNITVGGASTSSYAAETGIAMTRSVASNGFRNAHITVTGFKSYKDAAYASGGRYGEGIDIQWSDYVELETCTVDTPSRTTGDGIGILDANNLTIANCTIHNAGLRGIASDDGTSANVAATWVNWSIHGNVIDGTCSNESIYMETSGTPTIGNLILAENHENVSGSFRSIFTNHLATSAKIVNNTRLGTRAAPAWGSTGFNPTSGTVNNN